MRISQQENGRKQAEFLKMWPNLFRNWQNFTTSLAGRPCCDLATVSFSRPGDQQTQMANSGQLMEQLGD
jgi:hypothetical protein